MPSKVYSAAVVGVDAFEIEIEVHAGWGPEGRVAVVGLPDTAVKESRDRVLSALSNSALRRPRGRITINLAPATVRKEGPSFDLPIALAMLQLNEQNRIPELDHCYVCGELALSGELRPPDVRINPERGRTSRQPGGHKLLMIGYRSHELDLSPIGAMTKQVLSLIRYL